MQVVFYTNSSDAKKITKALRLVKTIECSVKEPCNLLEPYITMRKSDLTGWNRVNYAYITDFNRYYFMGVPEMDTAGRLGVKLTVDPLMSNQSAVLAVTCIIRRSEHVYNKMICDPLVPVRAKRGVKFIEIGSLPNQDCYCLTCDGGEI